MRSVPGWVFLPLLALPLMLFLSEVVLIVMVTHFVLYFAFSVPLGARVCACDEHGRAFRTRARLVRTLTWVILVGVVLSLPLVMLLNGSPWMMPAFLFTQLGFPAIILLPKLARSPVQLLRRDGARQTLSGFGRGYLALLPYRP